MSRLNVTNGDAVADLLRQGGVSGESLPWNDLLHEGPVRAGLSLDEMSRQRARFVRDALDDRSFDQVLAAFSARDAVLKAFKRHDEVTLWFAHHLHDQLQLLQVLHWFAGRGLGRTRLTLVCVDRLAGEERFLGLGQLSAEQLAGLDGEREEIGRAQLDLAALGWEAFCGDRPQGLARLVGQDLSALPFLKAALLRHLEQFPWTRDGLSRTERQIAEAVAGGPVPLAQVFRVSQIEREEHPFMADRAFLLHLERICGGRSNVVRFTDGERLASAGAASGDDRTWDRTLQLTEVGRKMLAGQADNVRLYGIDRWLGGVHLEGAHAAWRWDDRRGAVIALSG